MKLFCPNFSPFVSLLKEFLLRFWIMSWYFPCWIQTFISDVLLKFVISVALYLPQQISTIHCLLSLIRLSRLFQKVLQDQTANNSKQIFLQLFSKSNSSINRKFWIFVQTTNYGSKTFSVLIFISFFVTWQNKLSLNRINICCGNFITIKGLFLLSSLYLLHANFLHRIFAMVTPG